MKDNKGFIAISLIYSFFLVFLVTLLTIVNDYAHNRILLNDVKKETQEYLNQLAEFNPVVLENKAYTLNEEVIFGSEKWNVLKDEGEKVYLALNRTLTKEEIDFAKSELELENISNNNTTLMCLNVYSTTICNYNNPVTFNYYTWNISVVKKILDVWFDNNASLQKAMQKGSLQKMHYSDNIMNHENYIRIPNFAEYSIINDSSLWYLTNGNRINGVSYLQIGSELVGAHTTYKKIRPVIMVKKSI